MQVLMTASKQSQDGTSSSIPVGWLFKKKDRNMKRTRNYTVVLEGKLPLFIYHRLININVFLHTIHYKLHKTALPKPDDSAHIRGPV
jgi:hypothetical protein